MRILRPLKGVLLTIFFIFGFAEPVTCEPSECDILVHQNEDTFFIIWNSTIDGKETRGNQTVKSSLTDQSTPMQIFFSTPCQEDFRERQFKITFRANVNKEYDVICSTRMNKTSGPGDIHSEFEQSQPMLAHFFVFIIGRPSLYAKTALGNDEEIFVYSKLNQSLGDKFKKHVVDFYDDLKMKSFRQKLDFIVLPEGGIPSLFLTFSGMIFVNEEVLIDKFKDVNGKFLLAQAMVFQYTHIDWFAQSDKDKIFFDELAFLLSFFLAEEIPKENVSKVIEAHKVFAQKTFSSSLQDFQYNRVFILKYLFERSTFLEEFANYKAVNSNNYSEFRFYDFMDGKDRKERKESFPEGQTLREIMEPHNMNNGLAPFVLVLENKENKRIELELFEEETRSYKHENLFFPIIIRSDDEVRNEWFTYSKLHQFDITVEKLVVVESPCPFLRVTYGVESVIKTVIKKFKTVMKPYQKIDTLKSFFSALKKTEFAGDKVLDLLCSLDKNDHILTLEECFEILREFLVTMRQSEKYGDFIILGRDYLMKFDDELNGSITELWQGVSALYGVTKSVELARNYTMNWLATENVNEIPTNYRQLFVCAALRNCSDWEMAFEMMMKDIKSGMFDERILGGIACTENETQINIYLNYILENDALNLDVAHQFLIQMGANRVAKNKTWNFISNHLDALQARYGNESSLQGSDIFFNFVPFLDHDEDYNYYYRHVREDNYKKYSSEYNHTMNIIHRQYEIDVIPNKMMMETAEKFLKDKGVC